jgi:hypothetical protein
MFSIFCGFDPGRTLNSPGETHCPVLSGPSDYPQPGIRLIGTALKVHPCTISPRFSS